MICVILLTAFAVRTFEYGIKDDKKDTKFASGVGLQSLIQCFWLIIITMTTVGYGDVFPKSNLGRFIGVIACIMGMLIVSLIIVSLAVISEFTNEEKKAYSLIKKGNAHENVNNKAASVVKHIFDLRNLISRKKSKINDKGKRLTERFLILANLKKDITKFKDDYKLANSHAKPLDNLLNELEINVKDNLDRIVAIINKFNGYGERIIEIADEQKSLKFRVKYIIFMQEQIGKYIINLNNSNYKQKDKKRDDLIKSNISSKKIRGSKLYFDNKNGDSSDQSNYSLNESNNE